MKTIGILTGGGDCPGLNAAIRAIVRKGANVYDYNILGIKFGWSGLLDGVVEPLTIYSVSGILPKGGTILGISRVDPLASDENIQRVKNNIRKYGIDVLVVMGGIITISKARTLYEKHNIPVICIPKTIDNNIMATDYSIGFDTSVQVVTDAIDRLHTTAESHDRVLVLEVMGGGTGWIATFGGLAGGADLILIPEHKFDIDEVYKLLKKRHNRGKNFSIVVVAEKARPKQDIKVAKRRGIAKALSKLIEKQLGYESRSVVLGHIQRGGTPTAFDRILATRFGLAALELIKEEKFGVMVALQGRNIIPVPLSEIKAIPMPVAEEFYNIAETFFG